MDSENSVDLEHLARVHVAYDALEHCERDISKILYAEVVDDLKVDFVPGAVQRVSRRAHQAENKPD